MAARDETKLRGDVVAAMQAMEARGLNRGTSGNVSVRWGDGLLVTPSGVRPQDLTPEAVVFVDSQGQTAADALRPSSEWRMHKGILDGRADVNAVVHCHSRHATILACVGKPIPAIHYMVGVSGGSSVPVAPYAVFGSEALAQAVLDALGGRRACLMANHGQIAIAPGLSQALAIAEEIEEQAAIYCGALAIGAPNLLDEAQMDEILKRFGGYGQTRR